MIVVETNTVQNIKKNMGTSIPQDLPIADKLDRSDFGFDQDYYERMPLLLNALQDNSYIDPTAEMSVLPRKSLYSQRGHRIQVTASTPKKAIRKTSPQPFLFEYRSPYPSPFRKAASVTNSWRESYHNAQRLKNLNDVVKYLEKTLNAKFGELYVPSETQIAFSSMYVAPTSNQKYLDSKKGSKFKNYWNHQSDPLFSFKPDNPSDVNFLVDDSKLYFISRNKNYVKNQNPMHKCVQKECERNDINKKDTKLFDFRGINGRLSDDTLKRNIDPNNIYITTSRPIVQFRRKTVQPANRHSIQIKRTKDERKENNNLSNLKEQILNVPRLILHLNVYSIKEKNDNKTNTTINKSKDNFETTISYEKYPRTEITDHLELNVTSVEDFHIGSSGIIPINTEPPFQPTYPITTPIIPTFIANEAVTYIPSTNPPEILKFNPEDAKIPEQYINLRKFDTSDITSFDSSNVYNENYKSNDAGGTDIAREHNNLRKSDISKITSNHNSHKEFKDINYDETQSKEVDTLIIKLKNSIASTTQEYKTKEEKLEDVTETYVPQLNGHYRNMKYKNVSTLLKESSERYRKRLQNLTVIKKPTYVPMFLDNKQNATDLFK